MPTLNIATISYNSDGTEATIPDSSTYTSPARTAFAVYLQLWKMDEDSEETIHTVTGNAGVETVTSWTFDSSTDGWYKALIVAVPDFDVLEAYEEGDVVYYASTGLLYIALQSSTGNLPTNGTYFETILITDADIILAANVTYEYQDYLIIEQGKTCAGEAATEWYNSQDCSNCNKLTLAESMVKKRALVIAAQRFAAIDLYNKAETIARQLEDDCESC